MNVLRCHIMEGGYVCLVLQSINAKMWVKRIKQILNVLLKYNPIRNAKFQKIFKKIVFHLDYQSLIKNLEKCLAFYTMFPQLLSKSLERNIIIN